MKTNNVLRTHTGLHAFFPTVEKNVQEVAPVNRVEVATRDAALEADRPRLLSKRAARHNRRFSH